MISQKGTNSRKSFWQRKDILEEKRSRKMNPFEI